MDSYARHSFGAHFAEVRVDVGTGEVRVGRMLGMFAAGRILNPKVARSQLLGGMTMGIGMALHEESVLDREFGDYLNSDLAQYHVPTNADVPALEVGFVDEDDPHLNPLGVKGVGELGTVGGAPTVVNAVIDALRPLGVKQIEMPATPERVWRAMIQAKAA